MLAQMPQPAQSAQLAQSAQPAQSAEPTQTDSNIIPIRPKPFAQHETKHRKGLSKGVSEDNIKTGKRERRPATFTLDRIHLDTNTDFGKVYYSAFATSITTIYPDRTHSRDLPKLPKTYKELNHYQYSSGFK